MLRDRIVCGIEDPKIQRRLLAEPELTFDKAFELSLVSESADKNAKDLQPAKSLYINYTSNHRHATTVEESTSRETVVTNLQSATTVVKSDTYVACVCKSKSKFTTGRVSRPQQCSIGARSISRLSNTLLEDNDDYSIYTRTEPPVKPLVVSVKLNNADLEMELDTGASISIISEATYSRLWLQEKAPPIQKSQVKLKTYSGEQLTVKGVIDVEVQCKD